MYERGVARASKTRGPGAQTRESARHLTHHIGVRDRHAARHCGRRLLRREQHRMHGRDNRPWLLQEVAEKRNPDLVLADGQDATSALAGSLFAAEGPDEET